MAITEGAIIAINGADASSGTYTSATFDSTGGGLIHYFIVHEGAATTYAWTDNKSTTGSRFVSLGSQFATVGEGAGDLSIAAMFVWSPNVGTGHTITCTLGAARQFRYGGGGVLNGTFGSASVLAAVTQIAEGASNLTVDAGSLVTDAAAYLVHYAGNYLGASIASAGSGWAIKANSAGRHFQGRNETGGAGTFDPVFTQDNNVGFVTIAAAFKETGGGGGSSILRQMMQQHGG